jgi:hypothetical protein
MRGETSSGLERIKGFFAKWVLISFCFVTKLNVSFGCERTLAKMIACIEIVVAEINCLVTIRMRRSAPIRSQIYHKDFR